MTESNLIDPIIKSAEKLGALTPAAIFAFMWLWQSVKEIRRENRESILRRHENERREQSILSEERQTEALRGMAQNLMALRDAHNVTSSQISTLHTIISERLPRNEHS